MPSASLTGSFSLQLADGAAPAALPLKFSLNYTKKADFDINFLVARTVIAVPVIDLPAPRFVVAIIKSGAVKLSWASDGTNPTIITANPSPPPDDAAGMLIWGYGTDAKTLYIASDGPARGSLYLFQ